MSLGIITLLCKKGKKFFAPLRGAFFFTLPTTSYDPFVSFPLPLWKPGETCASVGVRLFSGASGVKEYEMPRIRVFSWLPYPNWSKLLTMSI